MYKIAGLNKFPKLVHGFSTKKDGNMSFLFGSKKEVYQNRKKFLASLGADINKCVFLRSVHGTKISYVNRKHAGRGMKNPRKAVYADGLVTDGKGVFLFLLVADCLPVVFFDRKKKIISLVHAGWKELEKDILLKAGRLLINKYDCFPDDIEVAIGPCIHKKSYLFKDLVQKEDKKWSLYIKKLKDGQYLVDLLGQAKNQLQEVGIPLKNLHVSGVDTARSRRFYSNYKSKGNNEEQGRFACVVGIRS